MSGNIGDRSGGRALQEESTAGKRAKIRTGTDGVRGTACTLHGTACTLLLLTLLLLNIKCRTGTSNRIAWKGQGLLHR